MALASFSQHVEDSVLVHAVLRGDNLAFKKLVEQNERLVCSIVFRMVTGDEDREDICQETFLKVYDKLSGFKFESKLSTWIANIAFNLSVNFLRKKRAFSFTSWSKATVDEGSEPSEGIDIQDIEALPDELLLDKERMKLLKKIIESLPLVQRTLLLLFHHDEFSLEEITRITSLPLNTVKSHLFRARKTLKIQLIKELNR